MNKSKKIMLFLVMVLFFIITFNTKVNAASASISASSTNVNVGDTVTITITINGAAWNVHVSGAVSADYAGNTPDAENTTKTEKKTFKASKAGTYKVTLSGDVTGSEDTSAKKVSGELTITAKEKSNETTNNNQNSSGSSNNSASTSSKSNNANLSNLGIKPNDFKGFKASKTSYDVTVPNDIEKVTVYATAQNKKATIKGNGTQKLKVGRNALNVVVTAEDGTTKTYTINVTREEAKNDTNETASNTTEDTSTEKNEETSSEENTEQSDLKNLTIKGLNLTPAFSPDIYEYKVDVTGDVSSLDIETEGTNHNVSIDIVGNENLTEGENTITLLVYNEETKQNSTYQIIVNKTSTDVVGINENLDAAVKKANTIRLILIGIVVLIIICVVIFIIVKQRLKKQNDEMYEYDGDDKDRLNLDDEDEFFNRVNNTKKEEIFASKSININDETNNIEENNNETSEYDTEDYFRTNKPKRKGKHF